MPSSPSEFDDLLQQAQDPVLGYLIRLTGSIHAAQDLLQSANLTAIAKQDSFAVGTNFVAWLRQIALNHYRNHVRKESSNRKFALVDEDLHELMEERYRRRREQEQHELDWQRVLQCLKQLPDHQQEVMTQFYLHGRTLVQVADATGRRPNAVGQTLYRARLAVVQCIQRSTDDVQATDTNPPARTIRGQQPT